MTINSLTSEELFLITYALNATADHCRLAAKGMPKSSPSRQTNLDLAAELAAVREHILKAMKEN